MPGSLVLAYHESEQGTIAAEITTAAQQAGLEVSNLVLSGEENTGNAASLISAYSAHPHSDGETGGPESRLKAVILLSSPLADAGEHTRLLSVARMARQADRQVFITMYSCRATDSGTFRLKCFDLGCNMVTASIKDACSVIASIGKIGGVQQGGAYACPSCGLAGLVEDDLHAHYFLYHVNEKNTTMRCPLCGLTCDPRQEFSNSGYWLPGGRVDPDEDFATAAVRETEEEAGVKVTLQGILRVEYEPCKLPRRPYQRMRVIFLASPSTPGQLPKSIPNYESVGAVWATLDEIMSTDGCFRLRGVEPRLWCPVAAQKGPVYPLDLLTREGAEPS